MKERPILFSAPMVRALLDGSKTQTRRAIKPQPVYETTSQGVEWVRWRGQGLTDPVGIKKVLPLNFPYGAVGEQLWVRETHETYYIGREEFPGKPDKYTTRIRYRADDERREVDIDAITYRKLDSKDSSGWSPSIFMPRWASRITLEFVSVRVERLQDISEADAKSEGSDCLISDNCNENDRKFFDFPLMENGNPYRNGYALLWESINGDGSWKENPWVWVVEFRRVVP